MKEMIKMLRWLYLHLQRPTPREDWREEMDKLWNRYYLKMQLRAAVAHVKPTAPMIRPSAPSNWPES